MPIIIGPQHLPHIFLQLSYMVNYEGWKKKKVNSHENCGAEEFGKAWPISYQAQGLRQEKRNVRR